MKKHPSHSQLLKRLLATAIVALTFVCVIVLLNIYEGDAHSAPANASAQELDVLFIDVGQAECILVTLNTGETMLIDAAESSDTESIFEELDERGITDIDVLISTHPHTDHIGGISAVIDRYAVGQIYMSDMTAESNTYKKMMDSIAVHQIPVVTAYSGQKFQFGAATCVIVSPNQNDNKDANDDSLALWLDFYDTEFMFAGDMEAYSVEVLLNSGYNIDADVLKVAHHGSSSGTSDALLAKVSPEYAVISCGAGNEYGHPHKETLDLLSRYNVQLFRTDQLGDVLFMSDGESMIIEAEE